MWVRVYLLTLNVQHSSRWSRTPLNDIPSDRERAVGMDLFLPSTLSSQVDVGRSLYGVQSLLAAFGSTLYIHLKHHHHGRSYCCCTCCCPYVCDAHSIPSTKRGKKGKGLVGVYLFFTSSLVKSLGEKVNVWFSPYTLELRNSYLLLDLAIYK